MNDITRRDFINGTLLAAGSSVLPLGSAAMASLAPSYYPPAWTGLRGSHPGSNDHAHRQAWGQKPNWGTSNKLNETYDLIVVGGGISGLSAAYFYQEKYGKNKKILILDNHDDFGGHAKRNEHMIDGQLRISYGGSQTIVEPKHASQTTLRLLEDIGVDLKRFDTAYDRNFYKRHNLGAVTYFNKAAFGDDRVVRHPFCNYPNYIDGIIMSGKLSNKDAVSETPLSKQGKAQLLKLLAGGLHRIAVPKNKLQAYLRENSYYDYLQNTLGIDDPGVMRMARNSGLDWASTGTDLMSIEGAMECGAMGFTPKAVYDENNPYIHHFPDGNAGIARALVKKLIPRVANGTNAEELVLAKFNYNELDMQHNAVRVRLSSTVVNVQHQGDVESSESVFVKYIKNNTPYQASGKHIVMACYNMMIPHIVTGLSKEQDAALRLQTKAPLQYTSVGLKNWRAFKEMEIGMAMSPGNMHQAVLMDFPVSMGGYEFTKKPDDPCVIQMIGCPYSDIVGLPAQEQYREARKNMLKMPFQTYEEEVRTHLTGMLPKHAFNFDKDVASISVNRWAHGYSVGGPGDSVQVGRQPFGRITIANCDAAASSDAKVAIDMAHRAVNEFN